MKLVTLSGAQAMGEAPKFSLFSLSGAAMMNVDPRTLSDEDAGRYMLYWADHTYPGVTFEQISEAVEDEQTMAGMFGKLGKFMAGGFKIIGKVRNKTGAMAVTPKQLAKKQRGLNKQEKTALAKIGKKTKQNYNNIMGVNPALVIGGGLLVGGLILILALRK